MNTVLAIALLQILFFGLLILDFIVPSGGILSVLAILSLGLSWWQISITGNHALLTLFLLADIVLTPGALWLGFRWLRRSPLANRAVLSAEKGYSAPHTMDPSLTGKTGLTLSPLRPYGRVEIEGRVYEAITSGEFIASQRQVRVLSVESNRLIVQSNEGDNP